MAAWLEQAAALDRKQRGAADRQLGAELLSREPGVGVGDGSGGCRGVGAAGEATRGVGRLACTHALGGGPIGVASPTDDL